MKKLRTLTPTLPIEIFYQHIFVHLPIKLLSRFKRVCRQWNDVIKEPNFVRMHLHHPKQQNNSEKLMIYSYPLHIFYSINHQTITGDDDDDDIQAVKLNNYPIYNYHLPVPVLTTIVGSVDGLVCISSVTGTFKSSTILVWNPTTGVHKILPPHPHVQVTGRHGIGFGYNSIADDYNIVRVVSGSRIDIYSLKTNSWKLFMRGEGIPRCSGRIQNRFRVCSVDGSVYWLACRKPPHGDIVDVHFIACFDLKDVDDDEKKKKKLISEIPVPEYFGSVFEFADLKVMGGCLSLFKLGIFGSLVMWSMTKLNENKNDQVEYRWINKVEITDESFLLHAIHSNNVPLGITTSTVPICLDKDGKIVLRIPENSPTEFVLYNTRTKLIKILRPIRWIGTYKWEEVPIEESQIYIESLVSPNFIS